MRPVLFYSFMVMLLSIFACKSKKDLGEESISTVQPDTVVVIEPAPPVATPEEVKEVIYYERTVCFGTCPSFIFTVNSEGACTYKGRNFVDMIGSYKGTVSSNDINTIRLQALALGYDTLQARYDQPMVSDLPSTITAIDGKRVINRYHGPNLSLLYAALDSLILKVDWQGVEDKQQ